MARVQQAWQGCLVALVALGLGLGSACKKEDGKSGAGGGAMGGGGAADDLSLISSDAELVMGINFAQVQGSALWKQFVEPKLMAGDAQAKVKEFKDACGMDPMTAVKSVSFGISKMTSSSPDVVVVMHGLDKTKSLACLDNPKIKEQMAKDGGGYTREGEVGLLKGKDGKQAAFQFVTDDAAVLVAGDNVTAASIKAVVSGGNKLKDSKAFVEMYGKVKTGDTLWFFLNGNSSVMAKVPGNDKPRAVFGSLNVADGLSVDVRARFEAAEAAKKFADQLNQQLPAVQGFVKLDKTEVAADGGDLKIAVSMSGASLQENLSKLGPMMGGGM